MTVELQDLRCAAITAQHRSLRQAAERLGVRQSTLSRRIRGIEYDLGAELFERTNGGTRPTATGREFLATARRIIEETDAAFVRLKARCRGENGRFVLGVYASPATGNLRATLAEYHRRFPDVDVQTVDGGHDTLLSDLAGSVVDVAIMTSFHQAWEDRSLPLWSERLIVAVPEHHRFRSAREINWPDLAEERILLPQRGPGPELERLLMTKCPSFPAQRIMKHDTGLDRLLSLVGADFGVLLMLEGATGVRCDGVVYRELHEACGATRLNFSAYWRSSNANPTLGSFVGMLCERYPDLSAEDVSV